MTGIGTSLVVDSISVTNAGGVTYATETTWASPSSGISKLMIGQQITAGAATSAYRISLVTTEGQGTNGTGSRRFIEMLASAVYSVDFIHLRGITLYITTAAADATARRFYIAYWT